MSSRYERSISTDNNSELDNLSTDMICLKSFVDDNIPPDEKSSIPQVNREYIGNQLSSLSTTVATGPDNIPSRALKCTDTLIADHLEEIYNNIINESVFPTQWKLARVTPIFKGDYQVALNFRPISILPVLSKLLECHVAVSLLTWLTKHNLLLNNQSSYRPNFSCITALIKLVDDLLSDIDKGSLNGLLLVDLRKAFDLINHDLLIEKLPCYHQTESSLEWFKSYLKNRKQFVKLNNHNSSELVIRSGVPQGSILGPVLFIIFMNDISLSQVSDPLLSWFIIFTSH